MKQFLLLALSILSVELIYRFNLLSWIHSVKENFTKLLKLVLNSKISDHWKERLVPYYAITILMKSVQSLLLMTLILGLFLIAGFFTGDMFFLIGSWWGLAEISICVLVYMKLRGLITP